MANQEKQKLKHKKPEIWKKIISEFYGIKTIGQINRETGIKSSSILNAWIDEFTKEKTIERNKILPYNCHCPICNQVGTQEQIRRHFAVKKDNEHVNYRNKEIEKIKELYFTASKEELQNFEILIKNHNLYCSPSFIQKIYSKNSDYKEKCYVNKSDVLKQQYKNKKRKRRTYFHKTWEANIETAPNKYLPKEKIDKIIEYFYTDIPQNKISEITDCKCDTIKKYWAKEFGEDAVKLRGQKMNKKIILTEEEKEKLKIMFFEEKTNLDISKKLNLPKHIITKFFKEIFTKEEIKGRTDRLLTLSIKRSLSACGKSGITGSKNENLCYELLKEKINYKVIHHDFELVSPYEIDITIPELKIAINWDGIMHREPIFGNKCLKNSQKRDKIRIKKLKSFGYKIFTVQDNCKKGGNKIIIEKIVNELVSLFTNKKQHITIECNENI